MIISHYYSIKLANFDFLLFFFFYILINYSIQLHAHHDNLKDSEAFIKNTRKLTVRLYP